MPALRTLGLVILSAFAVAVGIFGFFLIRGLADEGVAREAALKVAEACGTVIATGGTQNVRVNIPGNYHMRFIDNRIFVDGYGVPEDGFVLPFSEDSPELGPGSYDLSIFISDGRLVVRRT
ncbi:MAG: hypothetical protein ACP5PX_01155 [Candidatus Hadarchaeum sp.]|uniref:hypothetical protein n=1 Tax=Candidatus Hadarchaeum sp. TaxID=2883567 RepID=UPI003D0F719D